MKTRTGITTYQSFNAFSCAIWIALIMCVLLIPEFAQGTPVIDPTGVIYTSISGSSSYNSSYLPNNMFDNDVTGVASGATLTDSSEWATAGSLDAYVAFQLDNSYSVASLYFAQRDSGGRADIDQMTSAKVWVSTNTAFNPNSPPVTQPNAVIPLNTPGARVWTEYLLASNLVGRYFLIEFIDTNSCCNPGGSELRLGGALPSTVAPYFTQLPQSSTVPLSGTARFTAIATDGNTAPLRYKWSKGATVLNDGGRISGTATTTLVISNVILGDASSYTCTVTNSAGSTNASATLGVSTTPTDAVGALVVSNSPLAYWRLDETSGTNAADLTGLFNATYGTTTTLGNTSMTPPTFPGFYAANKSAGMTVDDVNAYITAPALNLNTNTVTMIAWLNPANSQDQYASLVVWRGSAAFGLLAYQPNTGAPNTLSYIWNNLGWYENSGLVLPTNQWCMAALVVTPSNSTLYLGSQGALNSYVSPNASTNQPGAFNTPMLIGSDAGSRVYGGLIDDVAIFSHSLSAQQIQAIYAAGVGVIPPNVTQNPVNTTNYVGGTAHFNVAATGSSPTYQWKKGAAALANGSGISGAQSPTLFVANVSSNSAGSYSCVVSNSLGSVPSSSASLAVLPVPTNAYTATVLSYNPKAYWQLNEPVSSTIAADYWGGYNGTVLPDAALGVTGPKSPSFPGFAANNTALQTTVADGNSTVLAPALNLNANTATVLMWIDPIAGGPGTFGGQVAYASLLANRSGGYFVFNYLFDGTDLSYQWDDYDWDSAIAVPSDQWEFVGMVIGPTNTTVYLGTNGVLTSSSTNGTVNAIASFAGPTYIGCDSGNNTRVFNGDIADVAFFARSLSTNDVATIYNSALGLPPIGAPPALSWSVTPLGLVFSWYGPFTLVQADNLTGPWTPANVSSGTPIPMTASKKFYRLKN